MNILFIDNFDSFTYNLVDEFEKRKCKVLVYRNDIKMEELDKIIKRHNPKLIVISPGPSNPRNAGICVDLIKKYYQKIAIFGVCLGHQCIVEAFGGRVDRAAEIIHGKSSLVYHDGKTLFENIENPFRAGRYHSLAALEMPDCLEVSAKTENNIVMAARHNKYAVEGVQFHPESIMTSEGGKIIENVLGRLK